MRFGLVGQVAYNFLSRIIDWIGGSPEPTHDAFQTSPQDVSTDTLRKWAAGRGYDVLDPEAVDQPEARQKRGGRIWVQYSILVSTEEGTMKRLACALTLMICGQLPDT